MNNILLSISTVSILLAAAVGPASANPEEINLDELDKITAGYEQPAPNGGAIIGNGSTAKLVSSGEVAIRDGAQSELKALNLVNSSESTVANGVNVFDGRITGEANLDGVVFDIEQRNSVTQDQRRLATLQQYQRDANTETIHTEGSSSTGTSSRSVYDQVIDLEQTTLTDSATTIGGADRSGAPTVKINFELADAIKYEAELNAPSASNSVGVVFNGEIDYTIDGGKISTTIGENEVAKIDIEMPKLNLNFDAMGCVAVNGSCTIDATRTKSDEVISDHSTLYTLDESGSTSGESASSSHETVQAPFELNNAQAEYVVVDESAIDVSANYLVSLSGGAQSGLRAMNVVNAAGSAVANGVNVAVQRSGSLIVADGPHYNLSQINEINHSR